MKILLMSLCALLLAQQVYAQGMSAEQAECLSRIREESDFIISRINLINKDYEKQVKQSQYGNYKSGDYSTSGLLDNTIRKYHRNLVRDYKKYPFRYQREITNSRNDRSHKSCLAEQLHLEAVGRIHDFELGWQEAIEQAEKNATFFRQIDDIN